MRAEAGGGELEVKADEREAEGPTGSGQGVAHLIDVNDTIMIPVQVLVKQQSAQG